MKNIFEMKTKSFGIPTQNKKILLNSYLIKNLLETSLLNKDIIVCKFDMSMLNNITTVYIESFYRTGKILKYKRISKKKNFFLSNKKKILKNNLLFCQKLNNKDLNKSLLFHFKIVNTLLNKNKLINYFNLFKKFNNVLFSRGFNLFMDFLKITVLMSENKIEPKVYLLILAQIFKNLTKKKHTRFIFFIKTVFDHLILSSNLKGIKLVINGKLLGKTRASTIKIERGSLSINTINSNLKTDKIHVYTLYGVFGFKIWLNYK